MSSTEIILIAVLLTVAGLQLYRKYAGKDKVKADTGNKAHSGSSFSSVPKDDDYEPYSGK